jgi:hypothetical protein
MYIGGKLKFKNNKSNIATIKFKEITSINNNSDRHIFNTTNEVLKDVGESISNYCITKQNNNLTIKLNQDCNILNNNSLPLNKISTLNNEDKISISLHKEKDERTLAEKNFDKLRLKKLPIKVNQEIKGYKKELQEKFKKILDNQTDHYDIPKVGTGN